MGLDKYNYSIDIAKGGVNIFSYFRTHNTRQSE